ncbi:MAG: pyrroline-5-carboxylate reductase [Methylophilaceae bacterium]|nr:pyrroline-5-carboxylate reductase [Methylophilaceae bacterium]
MAKNKLYFIGYGHMAEAIYQRLDKSLFENICLIEKVDDRRISIDKKRHGKTQLLKSLHGIKFCNSDIVILAVKPNQIKSICNEINSLIIEKKDLPVVISIAAGVTTTSIKDYIIQENLSHLQNFLNIYRAMPNLCASNGDSITGLFGSSVSDITNSKNTVSEIFNSVGEILWVKKEADLNIVTAISGSGPAYIFYIMEIMINSAQELGLSEKDAKKLVAMTLIGSGKMGLSIQNLKEQISKVSSKGGTTEAAIKVFEKENLGLIFNQAIEAAHARSKEISQSNE